MGALLDEWKKNKRDKTEESGSLLEEWRTGKKYGSVDTSGVNDAYFESYNQAANSFFSDEELREDSYDRWQGLTKQADTIRAWAWQNRDKLGSNYDAIMSATDLSEAGQYWGQFGSAEDYAKAFADYVSYKESDSYIYDNIVNSADYKTKSASGWEKYVSDRDARNKAAVSGEEDESFWDMLGRWMGSGGPSDSTLPLSGVTQVQNAIRDNPIKREPGQEWSDEQRAIFGYLYDTDPAKAEEYAAYADLENEYAAIADIQNKASANIGAGILHSLGALAASPLGLADVLNDLALGEMSTGTDGSVSPFEYSQAAMSGITERLNKESGTIPDAVPIIGGKGLGDVYGLGMNVAQSTLSAYTLGSAGTLISYFGQGAASAMQEAKNRGASDAQATVYGVAAGVFEGLAEKIGVDNLFKLGGTATLKGLVMNVLKQAGAEGTEEGLTSLLTNIADNVIVQENSSFYELVNQYVASGMSEKEAKTRAWIELAEGIAYDTIAGAASGGISGGGHTIGTSIIENKAYKNTYGQSQSELVAEGLELDPQSAYFKRLEQKLGKGKNLTGGELRGAVSMKQQAIREGDISKMEKAIEKRLEELGETDRISAKAKALAKQEAGEELSAIDKITIGSSKYGQRVAWEMSPETIDSGSSFSQWAEEIGTDTINSEAYNKRLQEEVSETAQNAPKIAQERKEGADTQTVTERENAPVAKETAEQTKPLSQNEQGDVQTLLAEYSKGYGAQAKAMEATYIDGQDVAEYDAAFRQVYDMGASGVSYSFVEGTKSYLTDSQKKIAYEAGKASQDAKASAREQELAKQATGGTKRKKGVVRGQGVSLEELSAKFNDTQRQAYKILATIAEITGIDIVLYKSEVDAKGNFTDAQGKYKKSEPGTLYIDINAGLNNIKSAGDLANYTMLRTFSHEFVHFIENYNPVWYNELRRAVFDHLENSDELISREAAESGLDYEGASREVVAEALTDILPDSSFLEDLANNHKNIFEKLYAKFKEFAANIKKHFASLSPNTNKAAQTLKQGGHYLEDIAKLFDKAAVGAVENYQRTVAEKKTEEVKEETAEIAEINADGMVGIDTDGKTVAPQYSRRTWTESEYVTEREKTAKAISKELGVSMETALSFIDNINAVSKLIADDKARLDYEPNAVDSASVLKPNSEYKWSVDMSTLCAKRLLFTGTFDAIQKIMADTAFDSEDIVRLRQMMEERGYEVACGFCYVESTRRELGPITSDFIERYKLSQKTGKPISRINSEGKEVELTKTKEQMKTTVDASTDRFFPEDGYTPTMADLNTTDIDLVKKNHPQVYEAYLSFMNARGQAKPKLLETRAEYKGEILRTFKSKSAVTSRNNSGGLRLQSFSDFEVPHLIDMMQIALDISRVGLKSQAYTKVPAFAKVFGNTGIKINLSLVAKGSGLDADGNLIFDDKEGMPHAEAFRLRDRFSKNVGTILVGKNDAHIIAAMADPRIDFIIPFHKSSWKESLYDALGLTGYEDYTDTQNEKPIDPERKIKNYDPSEYWDFSKTGDENAKIYLQRCKQDGRIPKFPQFQGYPGYWKLLIDFKMYDNDGVGSPQEVVRPIYDEQSQADIKDIFDTYKGGHGTLPVAQDVVDDFVKEYKKQKGVQEQRRDGRMTDQEVLAYAVEAYESDPKVMGELSEAEQNALKLLKQRMDKLDGLIAERAEQGRIYRENTFQKGGDRELAQKAHNRMEVLDGQIERASAQLLSVKEKTVLQGVLQKARKVVEQQERVRGDEKLKQWRERREEATQKKKYRARVMAARQELIDWLMHPLNKDLTKHVNENVKGIVINFLLSIDPASASSLKKGETTQADMKHEEQAKMLKEMLFGDNAPIDYSAYDLPLNFDERLNAHIEVVRQLTEQYGGDKVLGEMSAEQLKQLSVIMANLQTALKNLNRFHANSTFAYADEGAGNTLRFLKTLKTRIGKKFDRFLNWKNTRASWIWERFGEGGKSIERELRAGQATLARNAKKVIDFAKETFTEKEQKSWSSEIVEVTISGDRKVRLSVGMLMGFYELSKREQGRKHILDGGITLEEVDIKPKGEKKERIMGKYARLTESDIELLNSKLTDRQKEVADKLQKFMETVGADWGNYVTLARFGEKAYGEVGYYPITVDPTSLDSNKPVKQQQGADLYRLLNMSFTHELSKNTSGRVMVYNIFDVFSNHMADMAQYNAMALPVLDAIRWLNYKTYEYDGDQRRVKDNLRDELRRAFGADAKSNVGYAEDFVTSILKAYNGTEAQGTPEDAWGVGFMHKFNRAQIAYNLRVVVQQPMSVIRAAMVINPKYLIKALKALDPSKLKENINEMLENSGIALWKDLGYYDINISRGLTQMVKQEEGVFDKVTGWGMKPAEWADKVSWLIMWNAAKLQMADKGVTDLSKVSDVFDEIIYKTQVVDSVLTKTQYMRDKGFFARTSAAFMSEPVATASMALGVFDEIRMDMAQGATFRQAFGHHKGEVARVLTVYAVSSVMLAAVQSIVDAWRDDDEYEDFGEKWLEAFGGNFLDEATPLNKIPLISYIWDVGKIAVDTFTDLDVYGNIPGSAITQWVESLVKLMEIVEEQINGESNYTLFADIYKVLQIAGMSGLPIAPMYREFVAFWNNVIGRMAPSMKIKSYELKEESEIKYAVLDGYLTEDEAADELLDKGIVYDREEAELTAELWAYIADHKEYSDLTVSAYALYKENCKGVDMEYFYQAWKYYNQSEADRDKDGEPISGTKKRKVLDFIYKMPIPASDKKKIIKCFYK